MTRVLITPGTRHFLPGHYRVEGSHGWFVVHTRDARRARSIGVAAFGRGGVQSVQPATQEDIGSYKYWHGDPACQPLPFEN